MTDHLICLLICEQKNPVFKILLDDSEECFLIILGRALFSLIEYIFSPINTLQEIVARSTMGMVVKKFKRPYSRGSNTVTDFHRSTVYEG